MIGDGLSGNIDGDFGHGDALALTAQVIYFQNVKPTPGESGLSPFFAVLSARANTAAHGYGPAHLTA